MSTTEPSTAAAMAELRGELHALSNMIATMNQTMERNNEKLERLVAMEVVVQGNGDAINRAFAEVSQVKQVQDRQREKMEAAHRGYDRWLHMATGFVAAISIGWTVAGYRVNAAIDDQSQAVHEMRQHIRESRLYEQQAPRALGSSAP